MPLPVKVLLNEEIPVPAWQALILQNPHATPFQTFEWYNLINSVKGISAEAIAIAQPSGILALAVVTLQKETGILKGYFSRRGIIYGGPLIDPEFPDALNLLLSQIKKTLQKKSIYIETRNFTDYRNYNQIFSSHNYTLTPYLNIIIHLNGKSLEEVLASMKYNRRREIRLSLEENTTFKKCESQHELDELYAILSDLYKKQVKLPLPGIDYFKKLWQSEIGKVFVVLHNRKIIGGSLCTILNEKYIYTMYYCGIRNYHPKIFPSHLAVLAAIEYGINHGMEYFDFMGAGIKGEEYGVRKYKQEFGGNLVEHGRFLKINNNFLYTIGKIALKLKKLNLT